MERRNHDGEIRSEGNKVIGTASVVYNGNAGTEFKLWDGAIERFAAGAFDKHLATKPDVVALFNHDASLLLGRTPHTLNLRADASGLHYDIQLPDTTVANDLRKLIARGDLRGSSFAFTAEKVEWRKDGGNDIRMIREAQVHDVSVVTKPAYASSSTHLRAEERSVLEKERDMFETELRFAKFEKLMTK